MSEVKIVGQKLTENLEHTLIITRTILRARCIEKRIQACTPTLLFPIVSQDCYDG